MYSPAFIALTVPLKSTFSPVIPVCIVPSYVPFFVDTVADFCLSIFPFSFIITFSLYPALFAFIVTAKFPAFVTFGIAVVYVFPPSIEYSTFASFGTTFTFDTASCDCPS